MDKNYIAIVFDGPPSHEAGRFVEVNDSHGKSIDIGTWVSRGDGSWELRIAVDKLKDDNDMTVDTSREAVEALIAEARDYAGEDQCGGAELLRETAQTLAALLDERDAQNGAISTLSHTLSEQQQDIEKRDQRIRDLEAEVERLRALSAHWLDVVSAPNFESAVDAEARHYHDSACTYQVERDKLAEKLDAVKAYGEKMLNANGMSWCSMHGRSVLAILADTDEGKSEK